MALNYFEELGEELFADANDGGVGIDAMIQLVLIVSKTVDFIDLLVLV